MNEKEHKLLRVKISLEYEFVGDDIYMSDNIQKAGESLFRANRNDIINEAMEYGGLKITASEIKTKDELPEGYTLRTLPWLSVAFGNKNSEVSIGEILKE